MHSTTVEDSFAVKKEGSDSAAKENDFASAASPHGTRDLIHEHVIVSSDEEDRVPNSVDDDGESWNASKHLVLFEPKANVSHETSVRDPISDDRSASVSKELVLYDAKATHGSVLSPDPLHSQPPALRGFTGSNMPSRILPSVGAYTVQCANCFKWRLIPTKSKYEEIREHILDQPFFCDIAREWRPEVSCDEPPDIQQDGSRVWAIDKPSIAQTPPGWERELRIRGEGGSKFADVYYIAPSGKKLRSMVEVQKYLLEHPEHIQEGVKMSQFSFQIPKPLQENYVRKRSRMSSSVNEPNEVSPVLRHHGPSDADSPETRPVKQQNKMHSPTPSNEKLHNRFKIKIRNSRPPTTTNETV